MGHRNRDNDARLALARLIEEGAREHDLFATDYAEVSAVLARRGYSDAAARAMHVSRWHQVASLQEQANAAAVRASLEE